MELRLYGYWAPGKRYIAPYQWVNNCIRHIHQFGVPYEKMLLGVGTFAKWHYDGIESNYQHITMDDAAALTSTNTFVFEDSGIDVRQNYITDNQGGSGYIYTQSADALRYQLSLVQQYGMAGIALFLPSLCDNTQWDVLTRFINGSEGNSSGAGILI